jgi:hypothetical protein
MRSMNGRIIHIILSFPTLFKSSSRFLKFKQFNPICLITGNVKLKLLF